MGGRDQMERGSGGPRGEEGGGHREESRDPSGRRLRPLVSGRSGSNLSGRAAPSSVEDGLDRRADWPSRLAVGSSGMDNTQSFDARRLCRIRVHGAVSVTGDQATTWPPSAAASRRTNQAATVRQGLAGRRAHGNARDVSVMTEA